VEQARIRLVGPLLAALPVLAAGLVALGLAGAAHADTWKVTNASELSDALNRAHGGDVISLADGSYSELEVKGRSYSQMIRVVGTRNAVLAGITFTKSSNITLAGMTVAPSPGATSAAKVRILSSSHDLVFDGLSLNGRTQASGVYFTTDNNTSNVTLKNSEITTCGHDRKCIDPGATNLQILNNKFLTCEQCVWFKGGGHGATIRGNAFGKIFPEPGCTNKTCIHLNHVYMMGGGPWIIERNTFDDCGPGDCTSQLYLAQLGGNQLHDVLVQNNRFFGVTHWGIRVEGKGKGTAMPTNIKIVNNTVLSTAGLESLYLTPPWDGIDPNAQPVVANNILRNVKAGVCKRSRMISNLIISGDKCNTTDRNGASNLDSAQAPTRASTLVINAGDPAYAPATDFYGKARVGKPDIGAIEYGGLRPLALSASRVVGVQLRAAARNGWRVRFRVVTNGSLTLTARLTRGHRTAVVLRRAMSKSGPTLIAFRLPTWARKPGNAFVVLRAAAPEATTVTTRVLLRLRR
jgi:hypothetical protein